MTDIPILSFQQFILSDDCERMEPAFHPDISKYTLYPKPGVEQIKFSMVLNHSPNNTGDKKDFYYLPYPNYHLYYTDNTHSNAIFRWIPSEESNPTERIYYFSTDIKYPTHVDIYCEATGPGAKTIKLELRVMPRGLKEGECGHFEVYRQEGDVFGGASGSCSIETLVICKKCGTTVTKEYEYCN